MLLQITNTCKGNCIHCMQDSTEQTQHMDINTFNNFIEFAKKTHANIINISGGEPTEHPKFEYIVRECAKHFNIVNIVSNGFFVFNKIKYTTVKKLLKISNVYLQITTHKAYYPKYKEICSKRDKFNTLGNKCVFCVNPDIYILQLGRANNNDLCKQEAFKHKFTTSCATAASTMYQMTFNEAITSLENRGFFCKPLIDWQGNLHLSESWLCPNIGNIDTFDKFNEVIKFKPCGKCGDYKKLLENNSPNYIYIKHLMGIK